MKRWGHEKWGREDKDKAERRKERRGSGEGTETSLHLTRIQSCRSWFLAEEIPYTSFISCLFCWKQTPSVFLGRTTPHAVVHSRVIFFGLCMLRPVFFLFLLLLHCHSRMNTCACKELVIWEKRSASKKKNQSGFQGSHRDVVRPRVLH